MNVNGADVSECPAGQSSARVPVLMYHRVGPVRDRIEAPYCVEPARFAEHMQALASSGLRACTIDDFVAWLVGSSKLSPGAFLLTFDDGFLGVYEHAFPVLRELRWSAAVFLVSSLLGRDDAWRPDRRFPLLGLAEIEEMRHGGIDFHSHTRTHPDLTQLDDAALSQEIAGSKLELEELLGERIDYFAYPYGRFNDRTKEFAKMAGYRAAFSVRSGFNRSGTDVFRIRRLDVFGTDTSIHLLRKVTLGTNDGSWSGLARYHLGQLGDRLRSPKRSA